ncbi:MAG: hypothetical protein IPK64_14850 [bacterium]|nr:hypothetical protein [bacterium]
MGRTGANRRAGDAHGAFGVLLLAALAALAAVLAFSGCAEKVNGPGGGGRVNVVLDLKAGPGAEFRVTVSGADMDTIVAALVPGDDNVAASVSVPVGEDRLFVLDAFGDTGELFYQGRQVVDVTTVVPVILDIPLEPVVPLVYLNPHFARVALGSAFTITVNANDLPGLSVIEGQLDLLGNGQSDKLWAIAVIDSVTLAPGQQERGSQLGWEGSPTSLWFSIYGQRPLVDGQGDAALAVIHCHANDTWPAGPVLIEPTLYLRYVKGTSVPFAEIHVDNASYRLQRDRVPESFLGGEFDDMGVALADVGGGQAVLAGSWGTGLRTPADLYLAWLGAGPPVREARLRWPGFQTTTGLAVAAGGGFFACGGLSYGAGQVVRLDAAGGELWRVAAADKYDATPLGLAARPGGGCVVVGGLAADGWLVHLAAFDDTGPVAEYTTWDYSADAQYQAVVALDDTTFVAAGYISPYESYDSDATLDLFTLGAQGLSRRWTRTFDDGGDEIAHDLVLLPGGGFLLVGESAPAEGDRDVYVVRTDRDGRELWSRHFGRNGVNEVGFAACRTPAGDFVAVGQTIEWSEPGDVYLIRFDGNGELVWENIIGGPGDESGLDVLPQGNGLLVTGWSAPDQESASDILVLRLGSDGSKQHH